MAARDWTIIGPGQNKAPLNMVAGPSLAARATPASWMFRAQDAGLRGLVGSSQHPFDRSESLDRAAGLLAATEAETGSRAAILAIISHGPVHGKFAYMNLELVRHAGRVLRQMRGGGRPRLIIAVDPFALDMVSVAEEALYAGFMGHYHLGIDRAAFSRGTLSSGPPVRPGGCVQLLKAWRRGRFMAWPVPATTRGRYVAEGNRPHEGASSASSPSDVLPALAHRRSMVRGASSGSIRSVWRRMSLADGRSGAMSFGSRSVERGDRDTG